MGYNQEKMSAMTPHMKRHSLTARMFTSYDPQRRLFRFACIMWHRGRAADGVGYSSKLSFALRPKLFQWQTYGNVRNTYDDVFDVTVLGVRVHLQRSYGGIYG